MVLNNRNIVERKELLGKGSFGSVYRGDWLQSDETKRKEVAIKIVPYCGDEIDRLGRELYFLKRFNSPFTVQFFDSFIYNFELWILMDICDAGSLLDIYRVSKSPLSEAELQAVIACSSLGLVYIHEQRSIHRDIKAGNILLSSLGRAMLSDFGVSAKLTDMESRRNTVIGTPYWMAPEILLETAYTENVDVWSLGVTILEMAEGKPPYSGVKLITAMFLITCKEAPVFHQPDLWSSEMQSFLSQCLVKDPNLRASSKEIAEHSWIKNEVAILRQCQANNQNCSIPVLIDLAKRNAELVAIKRQQILKDSFDFEKVEDMIESWTAANSSFVTGITGDSKVRNTLSEVNIRTNTAIFECHRHDNNGPNNDINKNDHNVLHAAERYVKSSEQQKAVIDTKSNNDTMYGTLEPATVLTWESSCKIHDHVLEHEVRLISSETLSNDQLVISNSSSSSKSTSDTHNSPNASGVDPFIIKDPMNKVNEPISLWRFSTQTALPIATPATAAAAEYIRHRCQQLSFATTSTSNSTSSSDNVPFLHTIEAKSSAANKIDEKVSSLSASSSSDLHAADANTQHASSAAISTPSIDSRIESGGSSPFNGSAFTGVVRTRSFSTATTCFGTGTVSSDVGGGVGSVGISDAAIETARAADYYTGDGLSSGANTVDLGKPSAVALALRNECMADSSDDDDDDEVIMTTGFISGRGRFESSGSLGLGGSSRNSNGMSTSSSGDILNSIINGVPSKFSRTLDMLVDFIGTPTSASTSTTPTNSSSPSTTHSSFTSPSVTADATLTTIQGTSNGTTSDSTGGSSYKLNNSDINKYKHSFKSPLMTNETGTSLSSTFVTPVPPLPPLTAESLAGLGKSISTEKFLNDGILGSSSSKKDARNDYQSNSFHDHHRQQQQQQGVLDSTTY